MTPRLKGEKESKERDEKPKSPVNELRSLLPAGDFAIWGDTGRRVERAEFTGLVLACDLQRPC